MLIDTHSHLNFVKFKDDKDEVVQRSLAENVWLINVGINYESSKEAVAIAEKYPLGVYAAIGLHPMMVSWGLRPKDKKEKDRAEEHLEGEFDLERYRRLAESSKVVAIGESGLDFLNLPKKEGKKIKERQKEALRRQIKLAGELALPVIFHCRQAHRELFSLMESLSKIPFKGVVHCFSGNWEEAKRYLEKGLYLGFNGIIYKINLRETIKNCPLERMLVETDCPFLSPPLAGSKRNEPLFVKYIVKTIAEVKGESFEKVAETTTANARKLFKI